MPARAWRTSRALKYAPTNARFMAESRTTGQPGGKFLPARGQIAGHFNAFEWLARAHAAGSRPSGHSADTRLERRMIAAAKDLRSLRVIAVRRVDLQTRRQMIDWM